ncbi:hypothetical protein KI387_026701, partial [Taxus chinensis]
MIRLRLLFVLSICASASASARDDLISCLRQNRVNNFTTAASSPAYYNYALKYSVQNLRFTEAGVQKPYVLIFPEKKEEVVKAVRCCIDEGWEIRVRSGGHSYEGLSSTASDSPDFVIIDVMKMDRVDVDMTSKTAWAESGATVGQLYSAIANKSARYAFPAGVCPTMGTGGHFSGGGLSFLSRKYGLAADNIIDALLVDGNATVVDRESMGEDLFWALRGGGGGSWGLVLAWKLRLVKVPAKVTVFRVHTSGRPRVTQLVHRWQSVAPFLERELFLRAVISGESKANVELTLEGLYLGPLNQLLRVAETRFPEMRMVASDCEEMSWLDSIGYASYTNTTQLITRYNFNKNYFKAKSDFVTNPIPESGLQGAWAFLEEELNAYIILTPLGGRMNDIASSEIPFPHRMGNLYNIQYQVAWKESGKDSQYMDWIRRFYDYMAPYVSQSPRAAYVNYVDLDLGAASASGHSYFRANFERLVQVKSKYDPNNVFRNPQSIPVN